MGRERIGRRVLGWLTLLVVMATATTVAQEARLVGWFPAAGSTVRDFGVSQHLVIGETRGVPGVNAVDLQGNPPGLVVRNIEGLKNRDDNGDRDANTPGPLILNAASPEPVVVESPLQIGAERADDPATLENETFPLDENPATNELDLDEDSVYVAGKVEANRVVVGDRDAAVPDGTPARERGLFVADDVHVGGDILVDERSIFHGEWIPHERALGQLPYDPAVEARYDLTTVLPPDVLRSVREILIYVWMRKGAGGWDNEEQFEIYTKRVEGPDTFRFKKKFFMHYYDNSAWVSNSDNMWFPFNPADPNLYIRLRGVQIGGNRNSQVELLGWR